jgi:hypothetical protein
VYTWTVRETTWTWRTERDAFTSPSQIVIIEMFIHNEYYTWLYLQSKCWVYIICKTRCVLLYPINKMYAISEKSGINWSTAQINFNVHIKITKHCDCLHLCCIASYSEAQTENAKSMSYQGLSQRGINEKFVCIRGRSVKQHGHDRQNAMSSPGHRQQFSVRMKLRAKLKIDTFIWAYFPTVVPIQLEFRYRLRLRLSV